MACGGGKREAAVKVWDGVVEEIMQSEKAMKAERDMELEGDGLGEEFMQSEKAMKAEGDMELEEDGMGEEDWEQGGVALAKDY